MKSFTLLRFAFFFCAAACCAFLSLPLAAQEPAPIRFVRSGNSFFEVNNGGCTTQLIVAKGEKESEPKGVFLNISSTNVSAQLFNAKSIPIAESLANLFLEYKDRFTRLFIGSKSWDIERRSFSLVLPCSTRLTIDANNQYLTVVKDSEKNPEHGAIIGMFGLDVKVNGVGNARVLAANTYDDVLKAYSVKDGITLEGKEIPADAPLGLSLEEGKSRCLKDNALFLQASIYREILRQKDRKQQLILLKGALGRSAKTGRATQIRHRSKVR